MQPQIGPEQMTIAEGDRLPKATFLEMTAEGPAALDSRDLFDGRKVALFALPGAFTRLCSARHLPSFIAVADELRARGVDEIVCLAVNDPFVMAAWGEASGAPERGIRMVSDASGGFTSAIGLTMDAPAVGLHGRSRRYSMLVEDGRVTRLNVEPGRECDISAGKTLLAQL
jgi:glutaredoxin/glutathione-dependent peroxiredoxin